MTRAAGRCCRKPWRRRASSATIWDGAPRPKPFSPAPSGTSTRAARAARAAGAPPVAVISFLDARHARIYTAPGLFDDTLGRIGMSNAWPHAGQYWGFDTIGIERLSEIDAPGAHLIALEPLPREALPTLSDSPIWSNLTFVREGRFAVLPITLMFGMVNEAMRFAGQMADYARRVT